MCFRLHDFVRAALLLCGLSVAIPLAGQEPNEGSSPEPAAEQEVPKAEQAAAAALVPAENGTLRERSIYIPYTELKEVFEQQGRGVFMPYEEFQELWRQARASERTPPAQRAPQDVVLTRIASEATVQEQVMTVRAKLELEILEAGWHIVPLRLKDAAIQSATVGEDRARVVFDPQHGYRLLVHLAKDEEGPKTLAVELQYAKVFSKLPGQNRVILTAPQAPVNQWLIRIPQPGVKVGVKPLVAATQAAPNPTEDQTVVTAYVGAAETVEINWTQESEGASGLEALATVRTHQQVAIEQGVMRTRTSLDYDISRAELKQLLVTVPADQKVTGVFDANVRKWVVQREDETQTVIVDLFTPVLGKQKLLLELEKFSEPQAFRQSQVPVVEAVGVERQHGFVVVKIGAELRAEANRRAGLLQMDSEDLPAELKQLEPEFSYRFSSVPFNLELDVQAIQPRLLARELVEIYVEPEQVVVDYLTLIDVQKAGIFQLEFTTPAGYQLRRVGGHALPNATAAVVDTSHLDPESHTLRVNLGRKALGKIGLRVELARIVDDPNLQTPTGEKSTLAMPLPRLQTAVERSQGHLVVYTPESLHIETEAQTGLRSVSFAEALQPIPSQRNGRYATARSILAFAYQQEEASLSLLAERRKPFVTARQLLAARIESGVVRYLATILYEIRYSGVRSLRVDVPAEFAGQIQNTSVGLRRTVLEPQPEDVSEGYVAWSLTGETELFGGAQVRLEWDLPIDELDVGRSVDVELPHLRPRDTDRAWGQIAISKAETLDVQASPGFSGLRPIDPQHDLAGNPNVADFARAFEFHGEWKLNIRATRYELEEVKRTSFERALVRMVLTRGERVSVQALYRARSALQRLPLQIPADYEFDVDPLRINGEARALEHGEGETLFVPLVGLPANQPILIELRYTVPDNDRRLDLPVFPGQEGLQTAPAVQKVFLAAHLPDDLTILGSEGPWSREPSRWHLSWSGSPFLYDESHLLDWVLDGVPVPRSRIENFATDGQLHLFTTLRPDPPPEGSLKLIAISRSSLDLALMALVAVLGLAVARCRLRTKLVFAGLLLGSILLLGVFVPTAARQILDGKLVAGFAFIVCVWGAGGLLNWRNSLVGRRRVMTTAPPAPKEVPPDKPNGKPTSEEFVFAPADSPFRQSSEASDVSSEEGTEGGSDDV